MCGEVLSSSPPDIVCLREADLRNVALSFLATRSFNGFPLEPLRQMCRS